MTPVDFLYVSAAAVAAVAAVIDFRNGRIPNWLTFSALALGFIAHVLVLRATNPAIGLGLWAAQSAAGALLCGFVPFLMWKRDAMGGGDVKLLTALGALLGPVIGMEAQLYAFLLALLIAPIKLAYEGQLLKVAGNALRVMVNPFLPKAKRVTIAPELLHELRFGPAVLAGVVLAAALHWNHAL